MKYQKHFKILLSLAMTTPVVFVPITNVYAGNETVSLGETGYIYDTTETRETPYEEDGMDTSLYTDPYYTSDTYLETPHPDYLFTPEYPHSEYPPTPGYTHETEYPYTPGYTHDTEYPPTPGYTHETEYPYTSGYTHDTEYSSTPGYTHETEYPYNSEYIHEAEYPYTMGEHFIPNTHNEIDNTYSNYSHSGLTTSEVYGNDKSTYEVSKEKPVDNKTVKMESNEAKVVPAPAAEAVKPAKAEAKVEPKAESKVQPKVEAKAEGKVQPKVEAKVESKVQPKVESKTESKAETIVEKVKPATEEVKVVSKHIEIKDVVAESEIEAVMGKLTDVTSTKAPYDAIKKVMTKGLMQGYKDNSFKPEKEITRAEAAQVLAKLIAEPVQKEVKGLKDITPNKWFYNAVQKCVDAKIMVGYEDNSFRPNGTITKAEILVAVSNLQKVEPLGKEAADKVLAKYKDNASIPVWAKGYVAALIESGMIQELNDTLDVTSPLTREQMAVILSQIIK